MGSKLSNEAFHKKDVWNDKAIDVFPFKSLSLSQRIELILLTNKRFHCHISPQTALRVKNIMSSEWQFALGFDLHATSESWIGRILKAQKYAYSMTHFKHHTAICEAEIGAWGHSYTSILGFIFIFFKWCITIFISSEGCNVTYNSISSLQDTNTVQIRFRLHYSY